MKNAVIIGGGAAGMLCGTVLAENGIKTTIIEKNEKLGKKIYITGKGRCNLTNLCDSTEFLKNVVSNSKFLFSSISGFDSAAAVDFFEARGLATKEERGRRVFPQSDHASDVTKTLERAFRNAGGKVLLNTRVSDIKCDDGCFKSVILSDGTSIEADACVIATGGLSYEMTGSTGDGYMFARRNGHTVTDTYPSLVGLKTVESYVTGLEGLSLKNIGLKAYSDGKKKYDERGEMLFTHNGVSGPLILTLSALIAKDIANGKKCKIQIDLKPAMDFEMLDSRILRDFSDEKNKSLKNVLGALVPSSLVPVIIGLAGIDGDKKVNSVSAAERQKLAETIKCMQLEIKSSGGFSEAVITQGGVSVKEINPKTMESKLCKGLFFAGEVIDVDAFTGGYNLQIAWITAYAAAMAIVRSQED